MAPFDRAYNVILVKYFENALRIDKVIAMSLAHYFLGQSVEIVLKVYSLILFNSSI